ncbi:MAG: hypothetical protein OXB84_02930 [Halobacteriovoraceae bacterium]|nr:hypothetical protein [Halobacteriovoraceae bacterium]
MKLKLSIHANWSFAKRKILIEWIAITIDPSQRAKCHKQNLAKKTFLNDTLFEDNG